MEVNSKHDIVATFHKSEDDKLNWRQPPSNLEAEQALLGAILVNNRAFEQVSDFIKPEHFINSVHGRIFETIGKQIERGQEANPTTLQFFFEKDESLTDLGGHAYLARLAASSVTIINTRDYGQTIHD